MSSYILIKFFFVFFVYINKFCFFEKRKKVDFIMTLEHTSVEIGNVQKILLQNIQKVIDRRETLESLETKAEDLNAKCGSYAYFLPLHVHRHQQKQRCIKFMICLTITGLAVILICILIFSKIN